MPSHKRSGRGARWPLRTGLNKNLDMLRMSLYRLGEPRVEAGALWFGTHRVNGDSALVDAVKAKFGGAATIFLGDQRIATNVQKADGSRALGTRLTPGPAYERVLRQGLSYHGETEILGTSYLALYEPISRDGVMIGLLFAGVQKVTAVTEKPAELASTRGIGGLAAIRAAIEALQRIAQEQSTRRPGRSHSARPPMMPGGVSMPSARRRRVSKNWQSQRSPRGWGIWLPGISSSG